MKIIFSILFFCVATFSHAANYLHVSKRVEADKQYADFYLSVDEPIFGIQVEGQISPAWLPVPEDKKTVAVPMADGTFFPKNSLIKVAAQADRATGEYAYIASLTRPSEPVENKEIVFSLPVEPNASPAEFVIKVVKAGRMDGSVIALTDIKIEGFGYSAPAQINIWLIAIAVLSLIIIVVLWRRSRKPSGETSAASL